MMLRRAFRIVVLVLILMTGGVPRGQGAEPQAPIFDSAFWSVWGDGQAELSGYRLTEPRYGELREGTAVLIFVTETFSNSLRVKSDPGRHPATDEFPVIKLNRIEDFQTGLYDYNLMTSVFAALTGVNGRPAGSPGKISFGSQEWCGHVYSQALFDSAAVRFTSHSYFDGEADEARAIAGRLFVAEDALLLWARGLAWPRMAPGQSLAAPMLRSLKSARLDHRALEVGQVILTVEAGTGPLTVPGGTFTVQHRTAHEDLGRGWMFDVEAAPPHRIIRWRNSDGEEAEYLGGGRMKYWQLSGRGGEAGLRDLGLPLPAGRPANR